MIMEMIPASFRSNAKGEERRKHQRKETDEETMRVQRIREREGKRECMGLTKGPFGGGTDTELNRER